MAEPRIVTVFGATGQQGGAVVRSLVTRGRGGRSYKVRAVTRNINSPNAEELQHLGAEVIQGDFDDESSIQNVLEGAHTCFLNTNFWSHMDPQKDFQQGVNVARAALRASVCHVIYSGLEGVQEVTKKPCPHFDSKSRVEYYMFANAVPFTSLHMPAYYENFLTSVTPRKQPDGTYALNLPMEGKPMYGMSVKDIGPVVRYILDARGFLKGQRLGLAADYLTPQQYADILSRVLAPKDINDSKMTITQFKQLGVPGTEELSNMFSYLQMGIQQRNLRETRSMHPKIMDFEAWCISNKEALLQAMG